MIELIECVDLKKLEAALVERGIEPPEDLGPFIFGTLNVAVGNLKARERCRTDKGIKNTAELSQARKSLFRDPIVHQPAQEWRMSVRGDSDSVYKGKIIRGWRKEYFDPKGARPPWEAEQWLGARVDGIVWMMLSGAHVKIPFSTLMSTFPKRREEAQYTRYVVFDLNVPPISRTVHQYATSVRGDGIISVSAEFLSWDILLFIRKGDVRAAICDNGLLLWTETFFLWMEAA